MKNLSQTLVLAACAAFALPFASRAGVPASATQNVPGLVNYQGRLVNPSTGDDYTDGIYTLDLRLYTAASGGTYLWGGQYKVYVKDGYFNLMLGDGGATALTDGAKYAHGELWKALWVTSGDNTRYLSVTPHEGPTHATLSTFSEILPRQRLLSAPFAFAAQHAHYADYSNADTFTCLTNLTVNGTSTLKGKVTFSGQISATGATQALGPVRTSPDSSGNGTNVNLGNGYTSATSSNRASLPYKVYDIGQYLYFYSYYGMYFQPTAGSMTFTVPSSYSMKVTGSGSFVSDAPVNTLGGTGTTTLGGTGATKVKGSSVAVTTTGNGGLSYAGYSLNMTSSSAASISGQTLYLNSDGRLYLKPATNEFVYGQGEMRWGTKTQPTVNSYKPFVRKTVSVTINANAQAGTTALSDWEYANFSWFIGGFYPTTGYVSISDVRMSGKNVNVATASKVTSSTTIQVHVFGINRNWISEE